MQTNGTHTPPPKYHITAYLSLLILALGASIPTHASNHNPKEYYTILGVHQQSTTKEIKKAYRNLALQWHPDRNPQHDKKEAEAKFKTIVEAYAVLSDPKKKKRYDNGRLNRFDFDFTAPDINDPEYDVFIEDLIYICKNPTQKKRLQDMLNAWKELRKKKEEYKEKYKKKSEEDIRKENEEHEKKMHEIAEEKRRIQEEHEKRMYKITEGNRKLEEELRKQKEEHEKKMRKIKEENRPQEEELRKLEEELRKQKEKLRKIEEKNRKKEEEKNRKLEEENRKKKEKHEETNHESDKVLFSLYQKQHKVKEEIRKIKEAYNESLNSDEKNRLLAKIRKLVIEENRLVKRQGHRLDEKLRRASEKLHTFYNTPPNIHHDTTFNVDNQNQSNINNPSNIHHNTTVSIDNPDQVPTYNPLHIAPILLLVIYLVYRHTRNQADQNNPQQKNLKKTSQKPKKQYTPHRRPHKTARHRSKQYNTT